MSDLIERADWSRRSPEFGAVLYRAGIDAVVMTFKPLQHAETRAWARLREIWSSLPQHPNVLEAALAAGDDDCLLLRYAALDWRRQPLAAATSDAERALFVAWGAQIIDAFRNIANNVPKVVWPELLRPFAKIDVGDAVRLGFLPVAPFDLSVGLPPEASQPRARVDERSLVYAIGRLLCGLASMLEGMAPHDSIVRRCIADDPAKRYRNMRELATAWSSAAAGSVELDEAPCLSWNGAEEAVGWLALGNFSKAEFGFHRAWQMDKTSALAAEGVCLFAPLAREHTPWRPTRHEHAWADIVGQAQQLERERAFAHALALYAKTRPDGTNDAVICTAIARCQLALGVWESALDYARRALAIDSKLVEALSIRARSWLIAHKYDDALKCADIWTAAHPLDGAARYVRGRALFALARFEEARDAFDRAVALDPHMLEAMLLRREADRAIKRLRDTVGTQPMIELDLPEHLVAVRDAFAAGGIAAVLAILQRPAYDDDPAAKLVHARCLAFERRFEDAIAMFDRVAQRSTDHARAASVGKAYALLALDRAGDALALFDRACASVPADLDAIEGRASALRQLGREVEADDELQRVVAASGRSSSLRVRQAPR